MRTWCKGTSVLRKAAADVTDPGSLELGPRRAAPGQFPAGPQHGVNPLYLQNNNMAGHINPKVTQKCQHLQPDRLSCNEESSCVCVDPVAKHFILCRVPQYLKWTASASWTRDETRARLV